MNDIKILSEIKFFINLIKKNVAISYIILTIILILLSIYANKSGVSLLKISIMVLFIIFIMTLMVVFNKLSNSSNKKWLEIYALIFTGCTIVTCNITWYIYSIIILLIFSFSHSSSKS